jgi:hypothetical protein
MDVVVRFGRDPHNRGMQVNRPLDLRRRNDHDLNINASTKSVQALGDGSRGMRCGDDDAETRRAHSTRSRLRPDPKR